MGKAILSFIITVIVGFIFTLRGESINVPELGSIYAIATMGAFIIYFNDKNNKS